MTNSIDVLAVMGETVEWMGQVAARGGIPQAIPQAAQAQQGREQQARDAVAELIEAANVLEANASRPANGIRTVNAEDIDRLRAALAKVQP